MRAWFVAVLLLVPAACAYPDPDRAPRYFDSPCFTQNDRRFVHDFIGLLDATQGAVVEERACTLHQQTSAHLVLALLPDLEGQSLEVYAVRLFEAWGIGDDERLDGILVLYAADAGDGSGDAALRIEVGYGLESTIVATVAREAYDSIVQLKADRMAQGDSEANATAHAVAAGTAGLAAYLSEAYDGGFPATPSSHGFGPSDLPTWFWWMLLALLILSLSTRRGRRGLLFLPILLGRGGRGGGFGGGGRRGGGGGFGGGRSGGGGWGGKL